MYKYITTNIEGSVTMVDKCDTHLFMNDKKIFTKSFYRLFRAKANCKIILKNVPLIGSRITENLTYESIISNYRCNKIQLFSLVT